MHNWLQNIDLSVVETPNLIINEGLVNANIQKAIDLVGDTSQLRPHVKTNKIVEVVQMMLQQGIKAFKCATIAEAEMVAMAGGLDILVAYPLLEPHLSRFVQLCQKYPNVKFYCLVDSETALQQMAHYQFLNFQVLVDVNIGMNRTGVTMAYLELFVEVFNQYQNINLSGFHMYDGHNNDSEVENRKALIDEAYRQVSQILANKFGQNLNQFLWVAGGSPTFHLWSKTNTQLQASPGTFVFWDEGYRAMFPDLDFDIAAFLVTRVVSIIDQNHFCVDLGHKAVAAENPLPRVVFPFEKNIESVGHSEEHMVVKVPNSSIFRVGQVLIAVPIHICPTVALYENVLVFDGNSIDKQWHVLARKRKITI